MTDVWVTWWGDGKGRDSRDIGYWLSIYTVLSAFEGILITLAIAWVKPTLKMRLLLTRTQNVPFGLRTRQWKTASFTTIERCHGRSSILPSQQRGGVFDQQIQSRFTTC